MCAYGRAVHTEAVAAGELRPGLSAWDRSRLVLLAVWSLLLLLTVAVGQRETPVTELEAAVSAGRVDRVVVLGRAGTGDALSTQEVRWTDGLVRRTAQVTVGTASPGGFGDGTVRSEDLGVLLSRADPGLEVRRSPQGTFAPYGELLGWRVPGWVALTALVTYLVQLGVLVHGPQPWRATRWAWFWITTVPVVGTVLMLLLSGRTPGLPAPAAARRRCTGGWAFLLSSAVIGLLSGGAS